MFHTADTLQAIKMGIKEVSIPADSFGVPASKQQTFTKTAHNLKNRRERVKHIEPY